MTPAQIQIIRSSWEYILTHKSDSGLIFYDRLFEIDPTLRLLFRNDIKVQANKLVSMISFVLQKLNDADTLTGELKALGSKHAGYHVKPEHYALVGVALLWMLEKGLANQWTTEVRNAWMAAYTKISEAMMVEPKTK